MQPFIVLILCSSAPAQTPEIDKELSDLATKLATIIKENGKKKVTVLDFTDLQGGASELGKYIAEELTVNLVMVKKDFSVLDRANLRRILAEHKLTATGLDRNRSASSMKPIGITPEQAQHLHGLIDAEMHQDASTLQSTTAKLNDSLALVQDKLNKLTRGYLDELIDEESYQAATKDLVLEKTTLKKEKERVQRTRASAWIEPAKRVINTLEMAGKAQSDRTAPGVSEIVHKVGTNRLIARKTVTFAFAEPYDFIPSLLGNLHPALSDNPSLQNDSNWWSTTWCTLQDSNLRPHPCEGYALAN